MLMMRPQRRFFIPGSAALVAWNADGQVDRDHRVPAVLGKIVDRRDVLDARVVHQDVHRAERALGLRDQVPDLAGFVMSAAWYATFTP
jgi:hypothetical protein